MPALRSAVVPVPHAFMTRQGGASQAPFDSLNVSASVGDDAGAVEKNLQQIEALAGHPILLLQQVHGDALLKAPWSGRPRADGGWAERSGIALGIQTADCVPVLLADLRHGRVGAVHAGWRGTKARIAGRLVRLWCSLGSRPGELRVALGPAIRACCYEVSPALASDFRAAFGPDCVVEGPQPRLALTRALRADLLGLGVRDAHIDDLGLCTACDARFFSHRRDAGRTGRQLSWIASPSCG